MKICSETLFPNVFFFRCRREPRVLYHWATTQDSPHAIFMNSIIDEEYGLVTLSQMYWAILDKSHIELKLP
jgi:hypothetical protein